MANSTNPPRSVTTLATDTAILPLNAMTVIGLHLSPTGDTALMRLADGSIVRVGPGTQIGAAVLTAIDEGGVTVTKAGRATRYPLGEAW
ncbi:MAG: hypothetical protein GC146_14690 [Limimaricola sp.]|uniref:hypothetical protein n=1 Tax=Limimaricola sp. TaxID=2211665 RepID=UPI001DD2794F|nr:hypothetical protein [Limimaricola sp.]MBI1418462.1 hypothetical protein [Limimaricola sp.]